MFAQTPSTLLARWGGVGLVSVLFALPLFASCTSSEDTEPFIPAVEGAKQPAGSGPVLSEDEACRRVLEAAEAAYDRLGCQAPTFSECPAYLRPGGASGCYEYFENSVDACEKAYDAARTCSALTPCIVSAQRNDALETCQLIGGGEGGQAGSSGAGGAGGHGGAEPSPSAGAPADGGTGGVPAFAGAGGG
jgi:hypothetical protein